MKSTDDRSSSTPILLFFLPPQTPGMDKKLKNIQIKRNYFETQNPSPSLMDVASEMVVSAENDYQVLCQTLDEIKTGMKYKLFDKDIENLNEAIHRGLRESSSYLINETVPVLEGRDDQIDETLASLNESLSNTVREEYELMESILQNLQQQWVKSLQKMNSTAQKIMSDKIESRIDHTSLELQHIIDKRSLSSSQPCLPFPAVTTSSEELTATSSNQPPPPPRPVPRPKPVPTRRPHSQPTYSESESIAHDSDVVSRPLSEVLPPENNSQPTSFKTDLNRILLASPPAIPPRKPNNVVVDEADVLTNDSETENISSRQVLSSAQDVSPQNITATSLESNDSSSKISSNADIESETADSVPAGKKKSGIMGFFTKSKAKKKVIFFVK